GLGGAQFGRAAGDGGLDAGVGRLQVGLPLGDRLHLGNTAAAGVNQEDVLEGDPAGVFQPAPAIGVEVDDGVDRHRPVKAANVVIEGDDQRGGDKDSPVAVEGQKSQRAKDVEVGFDPTAGQVIEQGRGEHLAGGDDVAGQ